MSEITRRAHIDKRTTTERAIGTLVSEVETLGADVRLTDTVVFLGMAFESLADFNDGVPRRALGYSTSPDEWQAKYHETLRELTSERDRARLALKDLFLMMDESILVRNIDNDADPNWALKMLDVVTRLKYAHEAIEYTPIRSKPE